MTLALAIATVAMILFGYMDPATEMQEGQDRWIEDTKGMVTAIKVKPVPITVTKWEPVDVEV